MAQSDVIISWQKYQEIFFIMIQISKNTVCYAVNSSEYRKKITKMHLFFVIFFFSLIQSEVLKYWIHFSTLKRINPYLNQEMSLLWFSRMRQACESIALRVQQEVLADCALLSSSSSNPAAALSVGDSHGLWVRLSGRRGKPGSKRKMGGYTGTGKANGALVRC